MSIDLSNVSMDVVLVPTGLMFLLGYHAFLLYKIKTNPNSTAIGFENSNRRAWVRKIVQEMPRSSSTALMVMTGNISGAIYMISLCVTLSSLVGTVMGSAKAQTIVKSNKLLEHILYGTTSDSMASFKHLTILLCFMGSFISHVQSLRYYFHSIILLTMPESAVPIEYLENSVVKGSNYWNLGLRAFYISFPLLLWIFGPLAMFVCCLVLICFLYFMDAMPSNMEWTLYDLEDRKVSGKVIEKGKYVVKGDTSLKLVELLSPSGHSHHKHGPVLFGANLNAF